MGDSDVNLSLRARGYGQFCIFFIKCTPMEQIGVFVWKLINLFDNQFTGHCASFIVNELDEKLTVVCIWCSVYEIENMQDLAL